MIQTEGFTNRGDNVLAWDATSGGFRGFYSIYSVIRRYDAKLKAVMKAVAA